MPADAVLEDLLSAYAISWMYAGKKHVAKRAQVKAEIFAHLTAKVEEERDAFLKTVFRLALESVSPSAIREAELAFAQSIDAAIRSRVPERGQTNG